MLSERKKKAIILTLVLSAIIIDALSLLYDCFYSSAFARFLFDIGLTRWGWLPAIGFAAASISGIIWWKPGSRILRVFLILISIVALIFASIWFLGIYFITHLTP